MTDTEKILLRDLRNLVDDGESFLEAVAEFTRTQHHLIESLSEARVSIERYTEPYTVLEEKVCSHPTPLSSMKTEAKV